MCEIGSYAAKWEGDLMPPISLYSPYRRRRRWFWLIMGFRFSRAHLSTVASQKAGWRLVVHGQKLSLEFLLRRRDAVRWAKKENCKSSCLSALNAEENSQKLQSANSVIDVVCTFTQSFYMPRLKMRCLPKVLIGRSRGKFT